MVAIALTVASLLPALASAAPLMPRANSFSSIFASYANIQAINATYHQYLEVFVTAQYYLTPATGVSYTPADRFTTITLESNTASNTTGYLVYGYGGQSVTPLPTGQYSITNPAKEYANYILPFLPVGSAPVQLCTYLYKEPSKVNSVSVTRNNFDLTAFAAKAGFSNPIASQCFYVINGVAGKTSSSASASSTSTLSSGQSSSSVVVSSTLSTSHSTSATSVPASFSSSSSSPASSPSLNISSSSSPSSSFSSSPSSSSSPASFSSSSAITGSSFSSMVVGSTVPSSTPSGVLSSSGSTSSSSAALSTSSSGSSSPMGSSSEMASTSPSSSSFAPNATTVANSTMPSSLPNMTAITTSMPVNATSMPNTTVPTSTSTSINSSSTANATSPIATAPLAAYQTSVKFNGKNYVNKGLVGFGRIDGSAVDSRGETIGGIGSAIAVKSITKTGNTYSGVIVVQPDRGHNTATTTDYVARQHNIGFTLNPYYDSAKLNYYVAANTTLNLQYQSSLLYYEQDGAPTTGLDATSYRNSTPILPIASSSYNHISTDAEGLVLNADGTFWVSDEYGPYIYKYSAAGLLLQTIALPRAALPFLNGQPYFSASAATPPSTGRVQNQGFEGLAASPDGSTLYALIQSGLEQDLDAALDDGRYTRLFAWDVSGTSAVLLNSWVVTLPVTNGKAKTLAASDLAYISPNTFMILSRDGKGNGNSDNNAKNKNFYLMSTVGATDIAATNYTTGTVPVAPGGVLLSSITPVVPVQYIDILDETQLERFGLYNNGPFAPQLIDGKWESSAIVSCQDPSFPNDYFLFSFADNDFITQNGYEAGAAYSDSYGSTLDNQALVWRISLP